LISLSVRPGRWLAIRDHLRGHGAKTKSCSGQFFFIYTPRPGPEQDKKKRGAQQNHRNARERNATSHWPAQSSVTRRNSHAQLLMHVSWVRRLALWLRSWPMHIAWTLHAERKRRAGSAAGAYGALPGTGSDRKLRRASPRQCRQRKGRKSLTGRPGPAAPLIPRGAHGQRLVRTDG